MNEPELVTAHAVCKGCQTDYLHEAYLDRERGLFRIHNEGWSVCPKCGGREYEVTLPTAAIRYGVMVLNG